MDIAKYFEVMNSRGKQLEQHQILKAKFLESLSDSQEQKKYARLWDYCSNMDAYLEDFIYRYEKRVFDQIIGKSKQIIGQKVLRTELINFSQQIDNCDSNDNTTFLFDFFNSTGVPSSDDTNIDKITIIDALKADKEKSEQTKEGVNEYRSFIKFEYFLLHILRLWCNKKQKERTDIIFKDTKLIIQFEEKLPWLKEKNENSENNAKDFLYYLFRYRLLFDYFFFKRDKETDEPFIAKLSLDGQDGISIDREAVNKEKNLRQIMNLQLLFNFTGDFHAQHWIQSVFDWLSTNSNFDNSFYVSYVHFLESFDEKIMAERVSEKTDLQQVYLNYKNNPNEEVAINREDLNHILHKGTSTSHYWFYKLDYRLWRDFDFTKMFSSPFVEKEKFSYKSIPFSFRLSRLNSVEHIFPQKKKKQWEDEKSVPCGDCPKVRSDRIDCFGNLALISRHFNSSLSDDYVNKKLKIQEQLNRGTIESLKMLLFYSNIESSEAITTLYCQEHQSDMIDHLVKNET